MHVQLIDHMFDEMPKLEDINRYRILPIDDLYRIEKRKLNMNNYFYTDKPSEYPKKHLTFLGNVPGPANNDLSGSLLIAPLYWRSLGNALSWYYQIWRDKKYETVEEGIYRYDPE